jgi:hypothetical protein
LLKQSLFCLTAYIIKGRVGHFIAIDMFLEHYNHVLSALLRLRGSTLSASHMEYLSQLVPILQNITRQIEEQFPRPRTTSKHTVLAHGDAIKRLVMRATISSQLFLSTSKQVPKMQCLHKVVKKFSDKMWVTFTERAAVVLRKLAVDDTSFERGVEDDELDLDIDLDESFSIEELAALNDMAWD